MTRQVSDWPRSWSYNFGLGLGLDLILLVFILVLQLWSWSYTFGLVSNTVVHVHDKMLYVRHDRPNAEM